MTISLLQAGFYGLIIIFAVKLLCAWYTRPSKKGKRGERRVADALRCKLPTEWPILNDVFLPLPDGTTTQIDHVVVSPFGVFVIETKNYSGWIFGDQNSAEWTQAIYHKKSRFQNPLRQNYKHICALSKNLRLDRAFFKSVVAFAGDCTFKTEMPPNVLHGHRVAAYIKGFADPILNQKQRDDIASAIGDWQSTLGEDSKSLHVENLRKRHTAVALGAAPQCPYCGGEMVLRHRKSDGAPFYGCKRFPACRGIVKIA